jgi:zinc protease
MARRFDLCFALGAFLSILVLLASLPAMAAEERVGERVYLVRDKPGGQTHFQMIVGAGCTDETGGECRGLAHYLEHLVLVGQNPEHKEAAIRFFPDGGSNGWTSQRATVYVHSMPAREDGPRADLEKLFGFYAARLKDFTVSEADAERERSVVRQEHDWRVGSRPFVRFVRKLDRLLIPYHPSGQWVIGSAEDIDKFSLAEARAFHRAWYVINNVDFVVMADIEPAALKEIAARAFAGLEPRPLPPRTFAKQPAIVDERIDVAERDATVKRPGVYFKKLVRIEEDDAYAAGAARSLIVSFLTSRLPGSLYDVLVDRGKLAAGAPAVSIARVAPKTLALTVGADVAPDVAPEKVLAAITGYIEQLGAVGMSPEALARLKTRFAESRAIADQDPRQVYNRLVGWLAGRSSYENLALWPQKIAAVSVEGTGAMLKGLSGSGRIVTGTLLPAGTP